MYFLKLVIKNVFRSRLRSLLTLVGLVVAIVAFGLLQTVVDAWYAGSNAASSSRLITRNAISLVFPMPLSYRDKVRAIDGVRLVTYSNWFGGIYKEAKNFFPQFAVDHETYFSLYPDFVVSPEELAAFKRDRRGTMIGRQLADLYDFKVGDVIPIRGTIFPGAWQFTVRGIYGGKNDTTITNQMFFHWDYINEEVKRIAPRRADQVGILIALVDDPSRSADIGKAIDDTFRNSLAETLTETEKAFQLSFVAMTEAIVMAIRTVSFVVIFIIMAVVANTMAMTARERLGEYATFKALGFSPRFVAALIFAESLAISLMGCALAIAATYPVARAFGAKTAQLFPIFQVSDVTVFMQLGCAIAVGVVAGLLPSLRAANVNIAEGLRSIG
jgi:putative ABC transport system permease protein